MTGNVVPVGSLNSPTSGYGHLAASSDCALALLDQRARSGGGSGGTFRGRHRFPRWRVIAILRRAAETFSVGLSSSVELDGTVELSSSVELDGSVGLSNSGELDGIAQSVSAIELDRVVQCSCIIWLTSITQCC